MNLNIYINFQVIGKGLHQSFNSSRNGSYQRAHSVMSRCNVGHKGFTLIEVIIAISIMAIIGTIASVTYRGHIESRNISIAISQIARVASTLDNYIHQNKHYPDSLADIGLNDLLDPWENPYQYNIAEDPCADISRNDHNISTLNTDYDLYSMGKDGTSVSHLSAKSSRDDVIRANNGNYIGLATAY